MIKNSLTIRELFEYEEVRNTLTKEEIDNILNRIKTDEGQTKDPFYICILSGIGAWSAAIFIIIFLRLSDLIKHRPDAIIIGILFLNVASIIAWANKSRFVRQFSLALAISGNILVLFGFSGIFRHHSISMLVITQAIICGIVYPLYSNDIYRYLAPIALVILTTAWIIENQASYSMHFLIAAEMVLFGVLILKKKKHASLIPLTYSAATMLPATLLFMNLMQIHIWRIKFYVPLWPSSILLSAGLVYFYLNLAGGVNHLHEVWLILAICSTILLGIFTTPGILVSIGLIVLGYAYGDRILSGLSYLFLPCFLVIFYYALNVDLAYKSWILAGSGLILLVVRWIANFLQPEEEFI